MRYLAIIMIVIARGRDALAIIGYWLIDKCIFIAQE